MIHPIIKSNIKSIHDSSNYRLISIMLIIAKIFEACVAKIIDNKLVFHENQFGFSRNGGCGRALFAFRNIIEYFRQKNSSVYICSLDLSKAFDKINHVALLEKMHEKGISSCLIKVFASRFDNLCGQIYIGIMIFPLFSQFDLEYPKVVFWEVNSLIS